MLILLLLLLLLLLLFLLSLLKGMMVIFKSTLPPTIDFTNKSAFKLTVNIWKSDVWAADKDVNMKAIFALMNTTWVVVKIRPEKNSGLYGIWTHDLCDTDRALHRYRKGHEFKSLTGLNFFQALFLLLLWKLFYVKANGRADNQSDPAHGWECNALGLSISIWFHIRISDSTLVSVNRSFIFKSNIWITHHSLNLSFISSRYFIEKKGDNAKKIIISRGHMKLKERRGHGFALPSEFAEGTEFRVNCHIVELAAILKNKS